jgi:hypothetical protein
MKELPGKSACDLWHDEHCQMPTPETEQMRLNCLQSLARHMTELVKLRFDQIGMPMFNPQAEDFENFDDIEEERLPVSKYFVWPFYDSFCSIKRGPFASTQAYVNNAIHKYDGVGHHQPPSADDGTSKFFDIVLSHPVFHSSPTDTFALRHSDLDLQNILIDEEGNVTGILDWDGSLAMPRCVGHASVPAFLDLDFYPNALVNSPFLCWRAGYYREIYAAALADAGNPDVEFTMKSHIYQAVFAALYEGGDKEDLMARLVKEIDVQIDICDLKYLLAKGCKAMEEMIKKKLWKVLEPQMPAEGLLDAI